ncbi:MAG: hypothetical protein GXO73_10640, partial [Calditrichaeota bacterium]|nr:hypothetical protein [Calditrichota bacterium]
MKRTALSVTLATLLSLGVCAAGNGERIRFGVTPTGLLTPRDSTVVHSDGTVEVFSPARLCRFVARADGEGSDTFSLEAASVWQGDSLLYRVAEPCGDGVYLSDTGWLATLTPVDSPWGTRWVRLYAPDGRLVVQSRVRTPHAFALASSGVTFVVAGLDETVVLSGETGRVWTLPRATRVAVSGDGAVVATADSRSISVWSGSRELARFRTPEGSLRSLA